MQGAHTYVLTPSAAALSTFQHIHCVELHLRDIVPKHCAPMLSWHVRQQVPYEFEYKLHLQDDLQTMFRGSMRSADTVLLITYPRSSNTLLPSFIEFKATFAAPCEADTLEPMEHVPVPHPRAWEHRMFLNIVPVHERPTESHIRMDPVPAAAADVSSVEADEAMPEEELGTEEREFWNSDAASDAASDATSDAAPDADGDSERSESGDNGDGSGEEDGVHDAEDAGSEVGEKEGDGEEEEDAGEEDSEEEEAPRDGSVAPQLPPSRSTPIHLLPPAPGCAEDASTSPSQRTSPTRQVGRCRVVKRLA